MSESLMVRCPDECCGEAFDCFCDCDVRCEGYEAACVECAEAFEYYHSLCVW